MSDMIFKSCFFHHNYVKSVDDYRGLLWGRRKDINCGFFFFCWQQKATVLFNTLNFELKLPVIFLLKLISALSDIFQFVAEKKQGKFFDQKIEKLN